MELVQIRSPKEFYYNELDKIYIHHTTREVENFTQLVKKVLFCVSFSLAVLSLFNGR